MQQGLNDPLIRPAISRRKRGIEGAILNSHDMTEQWYEKEELSQMDERIYIYQGNDMKDRQKGAKDEGYVLI